MKKLILETVSSLIMLSASIIFLIVIIRIKKLFNFF